MKIRSNPRTVEQDLNSDKRVKKVIRRGDQLQVNMPKSQRGFNALDDISKITDVHGYGLEDIRGVQKSGDRTLHYSRKKDIKASPTLQPFERETHQTIIGAVLMLIKRFFLGEKPNKFQNNKNGGRK